MKVAVAQLTTAPYAVEENRALTVQTARDAFESGADVVVLPELAITGYVADRERLEPLAEPGGRPDVRSLARGGEAGRRPVVGGLLRAGPGGIYNAAIAVGPDGLLLHYRKVHPFATEKLTFLPGDLGFPVARDAVRQARDLRLLRPPLRRGRAADGAPRRRADLRPDGLGRRLRPAALGRARPLPAGPRRDPAGEPEPGLHRLRLAGRARTARPSSSAPRSSSTRGGGWSPARSREPPTRPRSPRSTSKTPAARASAAR